LVEEKALAHAQSRRFYHSKSDVKYNRPPLHTSRSNNSEPERQEAYQESSKKEAYHDSDSISELSLNSSSSMMSAWKNNPLAVYLRDVEEKTQLQKVQKIEDERHRASNRLKPKQLDTVAQTRLDELRAAKERQREIEATWTTRAVIPLDASKSQKKLIKDKHTRDWATIWTRHQMLTRIVVTLFSTASLFGILYMDTLSEFAPLQMLFDNSMDPGGIVLVGMSASFVTWKCRQHYTFLFVTWH
jgi:hypothetical protein